MSFSTGKKRYIRLWRTGSGAKGQKKEGEKKKKRETQEFDFRTGGSAYVSGVSRGRRRLGGGKEKGKGWRRKWGTKYKKEQRGGVN